MRHSTPCLTCRTQAKIAVLLGPRAVQLAKTVAPCSIRARYGSLNGCESEFESGNAPLLSACESRRDVDVHLAWWFGRRVLPLRPNVPSVTTGAAASSAAIPQPCPAPAVVTHAPSTVCVCASRRPVLSRHFVVTSAWYSSAVLPSRLPLL